MTAHVDISRSLVRPVSGAAPFDVQEIFFSRTDPRGVITAFNSVFSRIADFSPEQLLGAPHRLIRHADMPKGVFWLLWHGIQAGHPIGAFVKNQARDGLYYWVFALVTPIDGGYLSVRIKPTSALLPVIEREYAALLQRERDEGLTPADSAALLLARLREMGFASYFAFQTDALVTEFQARHDAMGVAANADVANLKALVASARVTEEALGALNRLFLGANLLTINMQVIATKLPEGRGTISEIARNYGSMLSELQEHLELFAPKRVGDGALSASIEERGLFLRCAVGIMEETGEQFRRHEALLKGVDDEREAAILDAVESSYRSQTDAAVENIFQHVTLLRRNVDFLRRLVVGLSTVRIACRVESGMLRVRSEGLETVVGRLDSLQEEIATILDRIEAAGTEVMTALSGYSQRHNLRF